MANAYVSLTTFKASAGLDIGGTVYDTRLRELLEHVSSQVVRHADRIFHYVVETRTFSGNGLGYLRVPDLVAIPGSGLKEDTNADGTYETVWLAADFLYAPYNAQPTATFGTHSPYTRLEVNTRSDGTQDLFLKGQRNYEITGTWGYSRLLVDVAGNLSASIDSTVTTMTLTSAGTLSIGETLVIDSEQFYITGTGSGSNLTFERAVNGSPAATHTATANVQIVVYPGPVQEAVFIQAARLWKRRDSGFASQVGFPETGQLVIFSGGLDKDVKSLISPYIYYSAV